MKKKLEKIMYGKMLNCRVSEVCIAALESIHTYLSVAKKNLINVLTNARARKDNNSLRDFLC